MPLQWTIIAGGYIALVAFVLFAVSAQAQGAIPRNATGLGFTPATKNTDGTAIPLACESGVTQCGKLTLNRIEYGTCNAGAFAVKQGEITVAMPTTTAVVSNLVVQTYCFRVFSRNDYNIESVASNVVTKTIDPPTPAAPLLAVSTTAYEIRPTAEGVFVANRVGVIPMGTLCASEDSRTIGAVQYRRVTRETLDLVNWPESDPLTEVWAVCG